MLNYSWPQGLVQALIYCRCAQPPSVSDTPRFSAFSTGVWPSPILKVKLWTRVLSVGTNELIQETETDSQT